MTGIQMENLEFTAGFTAGSSSKIAVIGAGISGLTGAYYLTKLLGCEVHLFEARNRLGGHAHSHTLEFANERPFVVDTGFIVFNDRNYPNFRALLAELEVAPHPTDMSFSVSLAGRRGRGGFEYNGGNWRGLFAQYSNAFRPSFWQLLREIMRFTRRASETLKQGITIDESIGDWLTNNNFKGAFVAHYLLPMSGAIWSTSPRRVLDFPISALFHFLANHGLLDLSDRPQWYSLRGGSQTYVQSLARQIPDTLRLNEGVQAVITTPTGVEIVTSSGQREPFDAVLMACHADDALKLLDQPDALERDILGSFSYSENRVFLHSDATLMPVRRAAWASWNYVGSGQQDDELIAVSYWMNHLQELTTKHLMVVTLNPAKQPDHIHRELIYRHPQFDLRARQAQRRRAELQGHRRIWYAGAHWRWGFHEDGARSALEALQSMGVDAPLLGEMEGR